MPDNATKAKSMNRMFYHCGSHSVVYSPMVNGLLGKIEDDYNAGIINNEEARSRVSALQSRLKGTLSAPGNGRRS